MRIRKFIAADMKDALAEIKRELGNDALIVAVHPVRRGLVGNGVEVTAAVDLDESPSNPPTAAPEPARALSDADLERLMAPLRSELRSLRGHLRALEPRPDDELRRELKSLRDAMALARGGEAANDAAEPSLATLAAAHRLTAPSTARVIALVGPTGVGKTTTIAKLAARAALVERRRVAVITLDDYRVGGAEQMHAFTDLIGVPLTVCPPAALSSALAKLDGYERVFVDTAGRSPRDGDAIATLARAFAECELEVHLAMPAGASRTSIDSTAARLAPVRPARLLFTKVDEGELMAQLVRAPARLGWPITWITTGQRVPEDLEDAVPIRLLDLATFGFDVARVAA
jgi:flagellar biosynthesis protein FlhF